MPVETLDNKRVYSGNGVTIDFDYLFQINKAQDIRVFITDALGVETEATSGFTVNTVTKKVRYPADGVVPLPTGQKITLYRDIAPLQDVNLSTQTNWDPKVVTNALDKLVMMIQQDREMIQRCIRYSISSTPSALETTSFLEAIIAHRGAAEAAKTGAEDAKNLAQSANADAQTAKTSAENKAVEAATSATNSANSATASSNSAANAATSEANALASKDVAAASETNAGIKAGEALASANNSAASALTSSTKANEALASANAAAQAVQSIAWRDVVFITITDSPFAITSAHNGKMLSVDTSSGAVIVNLPSIATIDLSAPFAVGIKKTDDSANGITINTNGTDKLDGASSKLIETQNAGATLIPDVDPNPDAWTSCDFGPASGGGAYAVFTLENVANGAAITTTTKNQRQFRIVQGNGGEATTANAPFGATGGWKDGTEILLCGASDTSPLTINYSDIAKGVILNGPAQLKQYYQLSLIYIQSLDRWLEISRNF